MLQNITNDLLYVLSILSILKSLDKDKYSILERDKIIFRELL
ncbi:MAG: hypothetical protein ACRDAS_05670 [Cetobacterium sp.]